MCVCMPQVCVCGCVLCVTNTLSFGKVEMKAMMCEFSYCVCVCGSEKVCGCVCVREMIALVCDRLCRVCVCERERERERERGNDALLGVEGG